MTATPGEKWDRRFAEQPWPTEPDPFLVGLAGRLPPGRGLDLGSGPGRNSLWLAAKGWDMTLVDASRVGLDQAAGAAKALSVEVATVHADLLTWEPEEARFDLVIVANLHPGPEALAAVLAQAARALRPGGHLYVVGHHVTNLGRHGPPDPDRLLTAGRLRAALPDDLEVEMLDTRTRASDHGHAGRDRAGHDTAGRDRAGHDTAGRDRAGHRPPGDTVVLAWATKRSPGGEWAGRRS